ncbi:efflux RND transporter periplasmic adaptor subunit [Bauldia sp.]|uniref:efflux RND transporter periplasmic adaptor subunit n=1 Tax=Bauldia sp. TaxID=2575872 RepID=UPI003BACBE1C
MNDEPESGRRAAMKFSDDPGASRATWVAAFLIVVLTAWFASGLVWPSEAPETEQDGNVQAPITVAVRDSTAEMITEFFVAEGQAVADRDTTIHAETSGDILDVAFDKGDTVSAGDVIGRFDPGHRTAELDRAQAEVERAEREFQNAETLFARGTATEDRVTEARTALAAARAQRAAAEQAIEDTMIRAPFDGRLEDVFVDPGEFFSAGAEVARVVDLEPLTVRARVPQQSLRSLTEGQAATVRFITGETREGIVRFVGASADPATRTFLLEIEVENEDGAIPAGVSTEVSIATGEVAAHFISPAILSLSEDGTLGLKTASDDNAVQFHEVSILRAESEGVWVAGLPDTARIITIGQGFVRPDDTIDPRPDNGAQLAETASGPIQ